MRTKETCIVLRKICQNLTKEIVESVRICMKFSVGKRFLIFRRNKYFILNLFWKSLKIIFIFFNFVRILDSGLDLHMI